MRKKYRIISAEGYPLHDSTLREQINASYILACLERTLQSTEGQGKDFKSSFARKAKSDLIAYERLRAKRRQSWRSSTRDLLRTSLLKSSLTNSPNLTQGEASGVKAEPTEGSPQGEESETKDEHMDATAKDNKGLERTEEFKYFCEVIFPGEERGSPMRKLIEQKNGYSTSGLYHSGVRDNPVSAFKVQHMAWRVSRRIHIL